VRNRPVEGLASFAGSVTTQARWRLATWLVLATLAVVMLATFQHYGTVWDEEVQFLYGEYVLSWFSSGFQDRRALSFGDLWLYGGLFDVVANLVVRHSPLGIYETRHLVTAAFGFLGIVATWRIGLLVAGPAAGLLSAILLALTPAYYGHSFNNPKDIPFAALAALALYYILRAAREVPRVPASLCIKTGLALGAALGVRVGGAFLIGYLVLFWGVRAIPGSRGEGSTRRRMGLLAVRLGAVIALAWMGMVLFWPWAQGAPFTRPFQAIAAATRFRWDGPVLFDGEIVNSLRVPRSYLPTWFLVTLPEAYFLALAAGVVVLGRAVLRRAAPARDVLLDAASLAFGVLFPFAVVQILRPVLYDAHRQFLFVLPALAVLAAWGVVAFARDRSLFPALRWGWTLALCATLVLTAVDMVRLHPYQTVYFNRAFAGGLATAADRFETDYWGASYREGMEAVIRNYRPAGLWPVKVANCGVRFLTDYWLSRDLEARRRFVTVTPDDDPDILIATTRYRCMKDLGRVVYVVERMGTPLLFVFERHRRGDWVGPDR
jgi:hypothetical protein